MKERRRPGGDDLARVGEPHGGAVECGPRVPVDELVVLTLVRHGFEGTTSGRDRAEAQLIGGVGLGLVPRHPAKAAKRV